MFAIATCGLIYELITGALASYLLSDSVTQFSTIIGAYLFAICIGSWLSRYLDGDLLKWFIRIEISGRHCWQPECAPAVCTFRVCSVISGGAVWAGRRIGGAYDFVAGANHGKPTAV